VTVRDPSLPGLMARKWPCDAVPARGNHSRLVLDWA
jgi:hypothetical protein